MRDKSLVFQYPFLSRRVARSLDTDIASSGTVTQYQLSSISSSKVNHRTVRNMIRLLWLMTMLGTCSASYFPSGSSSSLALIPQPSEDSVDEVMAFGYGQVLKGLIGGLIFFYGRQFPVSLLIYQSAMVTGLPGMKENWQAIRSSWRRARAALDTELPEITNAKKQTKSTIVLKKNLTTKMTRLKEALKDKRISQEKFEEKKEEVQNAIDDLLEKQKETEAFNTSFKRIYSAIDPNQLGSIISSIYVTVMASVAAASSTILTKTTIGLQLGQTISERVLDLLHRCSVATFKNEKATEAQKVMRKCMENHQAWVHTGVHGLSTAASMACVYSFKKMTFLLSSCTTGVRMMVNSCKALVDPHLDFFGL